MAQAEMKIAAYADLHLEFGYGWSMPSDIDADVLVLAGDIITFRDFSPLVQFLKRWQKPVLFVAGNHEYYHASISRHADEFRGWLKSNLPQVYFLNDESVSIDGVYFFGGTMWTDFESRREAMRYAAQHMSDFSLIAYNMRSQFTPQHSVKLHKKFVLALEHWFASILEGPRVVITHHAPVVNPKTKYVGNPLSPAFVCSDMKQLIEKLQPNVWIYGHTHECGEHFVGKTHLISNQLGYLGKMGYECREKFDKYGCVGTITL
jgi:Icc-related predicted phosphoesterase